MEQPAYVSEHFQKEIRYVYARTKKNLPYCDDELDKLIEYWPDPAMLLSLDQNLFTWDNGLVMKCYSRDEPDVLTYKLEPFLHKMENWAIFTRDGYIKDISAVNGFLYGSSFDFAQIFLASKEGGIRQDTIYERLRNSFKGKCRPVFFFNNGRIFMLQSDEPASMIYRRCERLLNSVYRWAIVDSSDNSLWSHPTPDFDSPWEYIDPIEGL